MKKSTRTQNSVLSCLKNIADRIFDHGDDDVYVYDDDKKTCPSLNGDIFNIMLADGCDFKFDMDISSLECEIDRVRCENDQLRSEMTHMNRTLSNTSSSSVASSECSDDFFYDLDTDFDDPLLPVPEVYLNSSILSLLDDGQPTVPPDPWSSLNIETTCNGENVTSSEYSTSSSVCSLSTSQTSCTSISPKQCKKFSKQTSQFSSTKQWSHMTDDEQIITVEEISRIIGQQLRLRDQLEVIQIISPHSCISPTDTEFEIDLDDINDEKLKLLRIHIQCHLAPDQCDTNSCDVSNSNSSTHQKLSKKLSNNRRPQQSKELRQRQRKEYRQLLKEKRSGLFKKEEVVSLKDSIINENDIVDIE